MAGDIRLSIQVDSKGAVTAVKQFNDELDSTPKSASGAAAAVTKLSGALGAAGAAITVFAGGLAGVGVFLGTQAGKLARYSDEVVNLATRFKITTTAVQAFRVAAAVGGTTVDGIAAAFQKMQVAIGSGSDVFAKLGLSLASLKVMSPDAALATVAQRIASIKAPAEQAAAAVAAFGKKGLEILPAMSAGFAEAAEKAKAYGLIIRDDVLRASEAFGDQIGLISDAWDAFLMRFGAVISTSPAVMTLLDELGKLFGVLSGWVEQNHQAIEGWVKYGITLALDGLNAFAEGLKLAITGMLGLANVVQMLWKLTGGGLFSKIFGFEIGSSFANADLGGSMLNSLLTPIESFQKTVVEMANAVDASGKKVAASPLFNGSLSFNGKGGKGGAGKKGFDLDSHQWMQQLQEYARINTFVPAMLPMPGIATSLGSYSDMPAARNAFTGVKGAGQGLMSDPQFVSALHSAYVEPMKKSSMTAAQALQNLANIASVSGSKLGKAIAGIAGGGAGLAGGIGALSAAKGQTGLMGILGKAGAYGQIATSVLSIGSSIFGLFKKKPKEPPPEPPKQATAEAWRSFTGDQLSKGASGVLAGVSGIKVTTAADMASQGLIASSIFWQTFKEKGLLAAAEAFRPVRDKMLETFKAAGADDTAINAMLGPMSQQIDLAGNESFKGAAEGSKGFADALAAMANTQMPMTIDQFKAFELQAVNGFNQMKAAALEQGLSMEEAIKSAALGSGQYLTTIKDAASKYGFDLGGSQALFDEAQKAGVAFTGSSEERLIMSIDRLTETLGGAPPKFEQAMAAGAASGAQASGNNISSGFASGAGGPVTAESIGTAIASKLNGAFDRLSGVVSKLGDRPVEVNANVNLDPNALANGIADAVDRGNTRLVTAMEGRAV